MSTLDALAGGITPRPCLATEDCLKMPGLRAFSCVGYRRSAVSEHAVRHYPAAAFYLLPALAWELLLGGLLCFTPAPSALKYWQLNVLSAIGLGGIILSGLLFTSSTPFPGLAGLMPCVATAVVIYSNAPRLTWIGRLLFSRG